MKKFLLAMTAVAAMTASASAADLGARPYAKAPPPIAPVFSWTGFYISGGAGGGVWEADTGIVNTFTGACILCGFNQQQGGDGWFGTAAIGYDWQISPTWVFGIFGDGQWGSMKGTIQDQTALVGGRINNDANYAAGVRLGYLVAPNVLSYVNAGWSGSHWKGTTLLNTATGTPVGGVTNGFDRSGWFIGGGVENNLNFFGINAPGWFLKTEYRSAFYDTKNISELTTAGVPVGRDITFKPWVQTITTSITYRFNWGGPPVAANY
ncbi:outer membrane protein [Bradyrhizobium lablabi]|uniref:outer membrane protein n=1 Tax=Bradyrhizobium lablabi TaxID=722472 RepID=UPI001BA5ABF3|nr:porin family protein [Bradyrhizobium lablabi]MBR0693010.1 porin family protein [Bradyrhizobium lablabi]